MRALSPPSPASRDATLRQQACTDTSIWCACMVDVMIATPPMAMSLARAWTSSVRLCKAVQPQHCTSASSRWFCSACSTSSMPSWAAWGLGADATPSWQKLPRAAQPHACTFASSGWARMAPSTAWKAPPARTRARSSRLRSVMWPSSAQPQACTMAAFGWPRMAASASSAPPRDTSSARPSSWLWARSRRAAQPKSWTSCDVGCRRIA
mmetsp:Transcript_36455/g.108339  ORF Transcript_36455/g.108339 Transcript_36455/m.108339 type:complete len:209 (-) Transcript_36455:196-822(-)